MAAVNTSDKKAQLDLDSIIKFQLLTYAFLNSLTLTLLDIQCLTELAKRGDVELSVFCNELAEKRYQKKIEAIGPLSNKFLDVSPQAIRNAVLRMEKMKLVIKEGTKGKTLKLNPALNLLTEGNILLNYKLYRLEA